MTPAAPQRAEHAQAAESGRVCRCARCKRPAPLPEGRPDDRSPQCAAQGGGAVSAALLARFNDQAGAFKAEMQKAIPDSYGELVKQIVALLHDDDEYESPDPARITEIDHGDYQGTKVFVIGAGGYQPYRHWYSRVSYGSCSGCDFLQATQYEGTEEQRVESLMTWARGFAEGLREMEG